MEKKCKACGEIKPLTAEFWTRESNSKDGFRAVCKVCKYNNIKPKKAKEGFKICSKCGKEKLLSPEFWSRDKGTKDGFHTICKTCRNKTDKTLITWNREGYKICAKCGTEKPLTDEYFKPAKNSTNGFTSNCRACLTEYNKKKRGAYKEGYWNCRICNRELELTEENFPKDKLFKTGFKDVCNDCINFIKNNESKKLRDGYKFCYNCNQELPNTREYYFMGHDGKLDKTCKKCRGYEYGLKYNVMNRNVEEGFKYCTQCERKLPKTTEYFHKTNGQSDGFTSLCKECRKKIIAKHIDKVRVYKKIAEQRRKSLKRKLPSTFTDKQWEKCKKYFDGKCAYCGNGTDKLEQDHFIALSNNGEYTKNNIVPACRFCNTSKKNKDFFEWYSQQEFYSKEREKKILKYLHYDKNGIQQLSLI